MAAGKLGVDVESLLVRELQAYLRTPPPHPQASQSWWHLLSTAGMPAATTALHPCFVHTLILSKSSLEGALASGTRVPLACCSKLLLDTQCLPQPYGVHMLISA
jgi:hypothetical protein